MSLYAKILTDHGIPSRADGSALLALDEWFDPSGELHRDWVNVSNWTLSKLLNFLGY